MRFSELLKSQTKDKVEIVKQQQAEIQKVFDSRIIPKENHTLFEFNILTNTIEVAEFKPPNTVIHWTEALEQYYKRKLVRVDVFNSKPITKSEVIKKDNCIYISALNKVNVIKILKRDFEIII
jgi:hypothetical protein